MKKKLITLLLAACLIVGLLPVVAAADGATASVLVAGVELTVTEGGPAAYTKNAECTYYGEAEASTSFAGWIQVKADETNWNVKFEYPTGGTPTLTFKGAKVDQYDNANEKWYKFQKDASGCTEKENALIKGVTGSAINLKIVFTDTTSEIENKDFLLAHNDVIGNVEIASANGGKLKAYPGGGFYVRSGFKLEVNADLDINVFLWIQGSVNAPLCSDGDIIINGGNLTLTSMGYEITDKNKSKSGCYGVITGNNITINGGKLVLRNRYYATGGNVGAILCKDENGTITINGGDLDIEVWRMLVIYHKAANDNSGIVINGGTIYGKSNFNTLGAHSFLTMNGGTLELITTYNHNIDTPDAIKLNSQKYFELWLGLEQEDAEQVYELKEKTYIKIITSDVPVTKPTTPPTTKPTTPPTTKPTTPPTTKPATQPTTKPTTQPTTQATEPSTAPTTGNDADAGSNETVIAIVVVVVVAIAAVGAVIIVKKKQAA